MDEIVLIVRMKNGNTIEYVQALLRVDSMRDETNIPEEISLVLPDDRVELDHDKPTKFITCWIPKENTK